MIFMKKQNSLKLKVNHLKVGDTVLVTGMNSGLPRHEGQITELRYRFYNSLGIDYTLAKVVSVDGFSEWVNTKYLSKYIE